MLLGRRCLGTEMVMLCLPSGTQGLKWFCDPSIRHSLTNADLLAGSPYWYAEELVVFVFSQQVHVLNAMWEQRVHSIMSQKEKQCSDGLLMWNYLNPCCWRGWAQLVCVAFTEQLQEVARPGFSNACSAQLPRTETPCKQIEVFVTSSHVWILRVAWKNEFKSTSQRQLLNYSWPFSVYV